MRMRCHKESIAPEERTAWSQTGIGPDNITRRERPVITASPLTGTSDTQMRPDWIDHRCPFETFFRLLFGLEVILAYILFKA